MLEVTDPQVRTVLLHHVSQRISQGDPPDLRQSGFGSGGLRTLRRLSVHELERLARTQTLRIAIVLDVDALEGALRKVEMVDGAEEMRTHFVRSGASTRLMASLFRMSRNATHRLRRDLGVLHPSGQLTLPHPDERVRILRCWHSTQDLAPRLRYLRLHQTFPTYPIAALELVIRQSEQWP
jgi:hypothetical protein